ncbi:MAG: hypothetical protein JO149_05020 [Gammaproteobacteria bacterium]|nr:hypothetical protein [Gammaproteobacteria bacterium]
MESRPNFLNENYRGTKDQRSVYVSYYEEAKFFYKKKCFVDAINIFNKIIDDANHSDIPYEVPPDILSLAYFYNGHSRYYLGDYRMAIENYKCVIEIEKHLINTKQYVPTKKDTIEKIERMMMALLYSSKANQARGYDALAIENCQQALKFIPSSLEERFLIINRLKNDVLNHLKHIQQPLAPISLTVNAGIDTETSQMNSARPKSLSAPQLFVKSEITEELYIKNFLLMHQKIKAAQWFSWFRGSEIKFVSSEKEGELKTNMSLAQILDHAKQKDNRSRQACIALKWMGKDGAILNAAPDLVKRAYHSPAIVDVQQIQQVYKLL